MQTATIISLAQHAPATTLSTLFKDRKRAAEDMAFSEALYPEGYAVPSMSAWKGQDSNCWTRKLCVETPTGAKHAAELSIQFDNHAEIIEATLTLATGEVIGRQGSSH